MEENCKILIEKHTDIDKKTFYVVEIIQKEGKSEIMRRFS